MAERGGNIKITSGRKSFHSPEPKPEEKEKLVYLSIRIPESMKKELTKLYAEDGIYTLSTGVRKTLLDFINRKS